MLMELQIPHPLPLQSLNLDLPDLGLQGCPENNDSAKASTF